MPSDLKKAHAVSTIPIWVLSLRINLRSAVGQSLVYFGIFSPVYSAARSATSWTSSVVLDWQRSFVSWLS